MKRQALRGFCLGLLAASLSGCALTTGHVNLSYKPKADAKSPLSSVKPLTFTLAVEDDRAPAERKRVAVKKNGLGTETANIVSDKDVLAVVHDAFQVELEQDGHKLITTNDGPANIALKVVLKKMWSDAKLHFGEFEMVGTINGDVAVSSRATNSVSLTKTIVGSYHESRLFGGTVGAHKSALNGALTEFIRNFAYDSEVLKVFEQAAAQSVAAKPPP